MGKLAPAKNNCNNKPSCPYKIDRPGLYKKHSSLQDVLSRLKNHRLKQTPFSALRVVSTLPSKIFFVIEILLESLTVQDILVSISVDLASFS